MRAIRFVQVGDAHGGLLHNLAITLNSLQSEFHFYYADDSVPLPLNMSLESPVDAAVIDASVADYMKATFRYDYPIAVCNIPLKGCDFASYDNLGALISTYNWEKDCAPYSLQDGIIYTIADILLDISFLHPSARIPIHSTARGCPSDSCESPGDIKVGLKTCDYCPACRAQIIQALNRGYISPSQMAASYKLLDFVAQRKICFVLMPFDEELMLTYSEQIKPTMLQNGWQCSRADEIYESRDIIGLTMERILRADLLIADLTGKNPNVFYELGFAHAHAKNTILITRSLKDIPFDLRHRQLIEYDPSPEGYDNLIKDLTSYLTTSGSNT